MVCQSRGGDCKRRLVLRASKVVFFLLSVTKSSTLSRSRLATHKVTFFKFTLIVGKKAHVSLVGVILAINRQLAPPQPLIGITLDPVSNVEVFSFKF